MSISVHSAPRTSPGRAAVSTWNSNASLTTAEKRNARTVSCETGGGGTAPPEVTVSASRASVREGSPIEVTLTRTGGGEAVAVGLSVSETGEMLSAVVS